MGDLTHFDGDGRPTMVDVSAKPATERVAVAAGRITMAPATLARVLDRGIAKGDVLTIAELAGIMGAKRTADLIPLCHPLGLTAVSVSLIPDPAAAAIEIEATCKVGGQTGVEMEALTAVSVAALTVYDMCKAVDRAMVISDIRLRHKSGGKSGTFDGHETLPGDLMSVDAARAAIIADIAPLAREDIALTDGLGRVLAEPLVARRSQPPMAVSAMDGFAARSADVASVPAVLTQIGAVQAGGAFDSTVGPGQCTRIFTGAPGARRRRHHRYPRRHHPRRRPGDGARGRAGWPLYPPGRPRFQRRRHGPAGWPLANRPRYRPGRRPQLPVVAGAPQATGGDPGQRR